MQREEESTSLDESALSNSESSDVHLRGERSASIVDDRQCLGSCKSAWRMKPSSSRSGCSKSCTKYKGTKSQRTEALNWKPRTLRESSSRERERGTKPAGELLLSSRLRTKMKRTSKKLQGASSFIERMTRRTSRKMKSLLEGFRAKRVLGFECDLKKCDSTLMECSAGACKKKSMIFGGRARLFRPEATDSSVSGASTVSSAGEEDKQG